MGNLRAGLVGIGMMGRHHARVLREMDGVDLVGIVDPSGDPHGVAGATPLYAELSQLIEAGVDMAVVAAPTGLHEEIGLALAEAGVHAMIEKPLAATSEGARRIAKAFADKGLVGCVGHIERYNPALQELRRRLEEGDLGEVYQVVTRRQGPFPARIADVGVIKDLATHDIDLTSWVAQSPFTSVAARTTHRSGREHEDLVTAIGTLESGVVTNHLVNWLSPFKERMTLVTGAKGAFIADTLTADLSFHANGTVPTDAWGAVASFRGVSEGDMIRYAFPKREPLRVEHEAFRDAVLGKKSGFVTMDEGLRTVVVAEAMIESANTVSAISVA